MGQGLAGRRPLKPPNTDSGNSWSFSQRHLLKTFYKIALSGLFRRLPKDQHLIGCGRAAHTGACASGPALGPPSTPSAHTLPQLPGSQGFKEVIRPPGTPPSFNGPSTHIQTCRPGLSPHLLPRGFSPLKGEKSTRRLLSMGHELCSITGSHTRPSAYLTDTLLAPRFSLGI